MVELGERCGEEVLGELVNCCQDILCEKNLFLIKGETERDRERTTEVDHFTSWQQ